MNQLAIKNINTLLNIDKSLFIFNNKEITINMMKLLNMLMKIM